MSRTVPKDDWSDKQITPAGPARLEQIVLAHGGGGELTDELIRSQILTRLGNEILNGEKGHYPWSIFIFDLDHFKHYNDTQGHQAGDEVLKITGQILRDAVRPDDVAARYGGEEFIVILPQTPKDGAVKAAERIREGMISHKFPNGETQPLGLVSLSGGVSTFPDDGRAGPELIVAADQALYKAKNAGRNRVLRAEPKYFSDDSEDVVYNTGNS